MKIVMLAAVALLAGCSAKVLQNTGRVVTIQHPGGTPGTNDAYRIALDACAQRGLAAVLVSRSAPTGQVISQFRCE